MDLRRPLHKAEIGCQEHEINQQIHVYPKEVSAQDRVWSSVRNIKKECQLYRMGRSVVVFVCSPGYRYLAAPAPDKSAPDVREEDIW